MRRRYVIRYRWCKTAFLELFCALFFAVLTVLDSRLFPMFLFVLVLFVAVTVNAYYVEVFESD